MFFGRKYKAKKMLAGTIKPLIKCMEEQERSGNINREWHRDLFVIGFMYGVLDSTMIMNDINLNSEDRDRVIFDVMSSNLPCNSQELNESFVRAQISGNIHLEQGCERGISSVNMVYSNLRDKSSNNSESSVIDENGTSDIVEKCLLNEIQIRVDMYKKNAA